MIKDLDITMRLENIFESVSRDNFDKCWGEFILFICYLLSDGHLWTIIERTTSSTDDYHNNDNVNQMSVLFHFRLEALSPSHPQLRNDVGPLSPAEYLTGFELGTFRFTPSALTH